MAVREVLKKKPDLCVSGINHGSNSSISVIYSGTMSAAIEAGIEGIPAIGFSLLDYSLDAKFDHLEKVHATYKTTIRLSSPSLLLTAFRTYITT